MEPFYNFSEDDKPFLSRWLADARDEMMRALSAYLSDESVSSETALVLPFFVSATPVGAR